MCTSGRNIQNAKKYWNHILLRTDLRTPVPLRALAVAVCFFCSTSLDRAGTAKVRDPEHVETDLVFFLFSKVCISNVSNEFHVNMYQVQSFYFPISWKSKIGNFKNFQSVPSGS